MTTKHTIEISKIDPYGHRVLLDGTDIANSINGLTITMRAGLPASVELSLPIIDVTEIQDAEARILIPDATRDTLTALGWTPPASTGDEPTGDLEITPFLVVHRYRRDKGDWAWLYRCWGDAGCDGFLSLDWSARDTAQREAHAHLDGHPATATTKEA
jgi:hypothetical protein